MIQNCISQDIFIQICIIIIMNNNFFNNRIKELREEKNLSQRKLAEITGIKQANISRWEKGINIPNVIDCWSLADFFNVSIDYLIGKEKF